MLDDRLLDGVHQVFPDVPPVRDMDRIRGAEPSGLGVSGRPVTAYHLDAGMVGEPGSHRCRGPVGQQVDRTARVDVYQDRAVVVSLAQGELVHSEHPWCVHFRLRKAAYQPQERRPARPDRERVRPGGRRPGPPASPPPFAAPSAAQRFVSRAGRSARRPARRTWPAGRRGRGSGTAGPVTRSPRDDRRLRCRRGGVSAVHSARRRRASRTRSPLRRRAGPHDHQLAVDHCTFEHNAFDPVEPQVLEEHITHGRS